MSDAFDITDTLAPNSDQLDAIELVSGPRTFRIKEVTRGNPEQPVNVFFHDFPRPWRPSKGMRRILAAGWGPDASVWAGRSVTLFFDPEVTFGKEKPGGTRISHMSNLDKPLRVPLLVARGRSAVFTVQPLPDAPAAPTEADVNASTDRDQLRQWWTAHPNLQAVIKARVDELNTPAADEQGDLLAQEEGQS